MDSTPKRVPEYAHMAYTDSFATLDQNVTGLSIGEYGEEALCAMEQRIPTIFAVGDKALCREAETLTPGVVTVAGKRGLNLDDGRCAMMTKEECAHANLARSASLLLSSNDCWNRARNRRSAN